MNKLSDLQQVIEYSRIPGMSVSQQHNGEIDSAVAGVTDTTTNHPVDSSTLFQAASLSKPVSAAIVLDLVEQGRWSLDKPLCEILDFGPETLRADLRYKTLTTRMVLGQCTGLDNWNETFRAEQGTKFSYSGISFQYLKQTIEKETGQTWENISQAFFEKAGMKSSTFLLPSDTKFSTLPLAQAHDGEGKLCTETPPNNKPAASLYTTSRDYLTFLQYCASNPFLQQTLLSSHTLLTIEQFSGENDIANVTWGLGMGLYKCNDKTIAFHWGNNPGSHGFAAIDINSGDCIACLANSDNGPNAFKTLTEPVVGEMTQVFEFLSNYCGFNAAMKPVEPDPEPESKRKMRP